MDMPVSLYFLLVYFPRILPIKRVYIEIICYVTVAVQRSTDRNSTEVNCSKINRYYVHVSLHSLNLHREYWCIVQELAVHGLGILAVAKPGSCKAYFKNR